MLNLLLACSGDPTDPTTPTPTDPDPVATLSAPGPYAVGYREETVEWTSPELAEPRSLRLAVWFPTDATTGDPVSYRDVFDAPGVLGGVEPAGGPLPVAVFSHGHQGYAENSSFLAEHFASHGWLVVSPDHTGNTTFDPSTRTTAIYWERPLDLSRVLDHAAASYDVTDEVVALGHSFGGYGVHALAGATYAIDDLEPACADGSDTSEFCSTMDPAQAALFRAGFTDDRVRALIAMAPGDFRLYAADGVAAVAVPELLMTGGLDPGEDGPRYWDALHGADDVHVHVPTLGHQGFTDFGEALDPAGAMAAEDGWWLVRTWALAFAEVHGRGDSGAEGILDGTVPVGDTEELAFH